MAPLDRPNKSTYTPAGQRPPEAEMKAQGLSEADLPAWWAFLRAAYPRQQRITGDYDSRDWIWFHAGWVLGSRAWAESSDGR